MVYVCQKRYNMNTLIVLVIILIILSGWNLKSLWDLKKFNRSKIELNDDKYYELKYKNEFITTIAIVVIGVGGFFGYKMSDEINKRADNLKTRLDSLDRLIIAKKDTLYTVETKTKILSDSLFQISNRISVISNKNIVKQDFYITDNLKFDITGAEVSSVRFYFKRLKTLAGHPFPSFNKAPFLFIVPQNGANVTLVHLEKDYFDVECSSYSGPIDSAIFGIMVSKK